MSFLSNLNRKPYFSDYNPDDNFYRVLSKAGFPLQARELTEIQGILGHQVSSLGSSLYQNGDVINGAEYTLSLSAAYVRLSSITQGSRAEDFIGSQIRGVISGVVAEVQYAEERNDTDDATLYINYISSGIDGEFDTFIEGETLESNTPNNYTATVGIEGTSKPITSSPMGFGSLFSIEEGELYVNGTIVKVDKQTISLCKYSTRPSFSVGLIVDEDIVTSNELPSLLDNSQGHSNFAAPGADRLKITLHLAKRTSETEESNFITLVTILQGNVIGNPSQSRKWEWLDDKLAQRTFDESGNYIVNDIGVTKLEYWNSLTDVDQSRYPLINDEDIDGVFDPDPEKYNINRPYPPVPQLDATGAPVPDFNTGCMNLPAETGGVGIPLSFEEADSNYALKLDPGLAYVYGYKVGFLNHLYVYGNKPRNKFIKPDTYTQINPGSFVIVNNTYNTPNFENINYVLDTRAFDNINLYRNFTDGHVGAAFTLGVDQNKGEKKPLNLGNKPWVTYHVITNKNVTITYEKGEDSKEIEVNTNQGKIVGNLVYPNRSFTSRTLDGYLITDPIANIINTEDGDRLVSEGTEANESINTNSVVVAVQDNEMIIRGDEIIGNDLDGQEHPRALIAQRIEPILSGSMQPKYYFPETLVNKGSGFLGYNSSYNLGVLGSTYYTELLVTNDPITAQEEWKVGTVNSILYGATSGASAKIEQVLPNALVVSNISGTFLPGEGVFQYTGIDPDSDIEIIFAMLSEDENEIYTDPESSRLILDLLQSQRSNVKIGRLIDEGEVISLKFNERKGSRESGELTGGGGDKDLADEIFGDILVNFIQILEKDVYTDEVLLTNPRNNNRNLRLPQEEFGFETQEDFNFWIYSSIKGLSNGIDANNVFVTDSAPDNNPNQPVDVGDIWINKNNYVVYVRDSITYENGDIDELWIAVTPGDSDPAVPMAVRTLATDLQSAQLFVESNAPDRNSFDLSGEKSIIVYSTGTTMTLYGNGSTFNLNPDGQEDFFFDSQTNELKLTDFGRKRIYKFAFFNPDRTADLPRVNYELLTVELDDEGTPSEPGIRGYATSSPAKIQNTLKKTKAFHSLGFAKDGMPHVDNFSADANISTAETSEIYGVANGALFTGEPGRNYVTCDNFSGDGSEDLIAGDVVALSDTRGRIHYKLVSFVTKPYGYGAKRTKCSIYFTTTLENFVSSAVVQRVRLRNFGESTESLLYPLPVSVVSSLETNHNVTGINYEVFREFVTDKVSNIPGDGTSITFTTDETNAAFISDPTKCIISIANIIQNEELFKGRALSLDQLRPIEVSNGGRIIKLNLDPSITSNVLSGAQIKAILPVRVTNSKAKRKFLIRDFQITIPVDDDREKDFISLTKTDVYRLQKVEMETDSVGVYKDVTDNYVFDNGQRDTFYDYGRLIKKVGLPSHTSPIRITMDYFEHESGDGQDFFSVDSYTHENGVPFEDIPVYIPQNSESIGQRNFENPNPAIKLRDVVDFRPSINSRNRAEGTGDFSGDILVDYDTPTGALYNYHDNAVGGNSFVPNIPIPTSQFESDVQYFLPKIDSLFLDKSGRVILKEGESSENPVRPADLSTAIRLYDIYMPAFTFSMDDVTIKKYNYRRYTMKDIMDIDKRVERVENLVTLSILEQSALNMSVRDAITGLDRFKNGIVVDSFKDHSKGDIGTTQYRCSIDPKETHLRPPYVMDQVVLEEQNQTDLERQEFGSYVNDNNIITVEYDVVDYINQPVATRSIEVQKYTQSTTEGIISLTPSVDTFHDTSKLPKLMIDNSDIYSASLIVSGPQKHMAMGTVWSEWETMGGVPNDRVNPFGKESTNKKLYGITDANIEFSSGKIGVAEHNLSVNVSRNYSSTGHSASTVTLQDTSFGKRLFDIQLSHTMRSIPVYFKAERLKPNTRYYAYFDDVRVDEWICVDKIGNDFSDGLKRYNGAPNSDPKGFGQELISDDEGNLSGVFIVPNGRSPVSGSIFNGRMSDIEYNTSGKSRTFNTGQRSLKLSSSSSIGGDITGITGFAKADFVSRAVIVDKTENIVSTRHIEHTTNTTLIDSNTSVTRSGSTTPYDPLAQTFIVDSNYPDGVFVKELDLFFSEKDLYQGVETYIVSCEGGVPTNVIVPHSRVVKKSNTTLRIVCDLINSVNTTNIAAGTVIKGKISGATGIVKNDLQFDSATVNPAENIENTVYNIIISNYNGEFLPGEELQIQVNPANVNTFKIAEDEVTITRIDLKTMGENYDDNTTVKISEPDLPGGLNATADVMVSTRMGGLVYELILTSSGTGYTKAPSVQIEGSGTKATAVTRIKDGRKSVIMGVSTSDDASAATTFKFKSPVYLLGNKTYAFVVKSPTSKAYKLWTSKIGELEIGTMKKVTRQPNMGALFTSQNTGLWTEDQSMDIMFNMKRAKFNTEGTSSIKLTNAPYLPRKLDVDPIETHSDSFLPFSHDPNSDKFGENRKVIRVTHYNHGMLSGDYVVIEGVQENPGGISNDLINGLHKVIDVDLDEFTVMVDLPESAISDIRKSKSGGSNVICTCNKPYETINLYSGVMSFESSSILAKSRSTQYGGLPSVPVVTDTDNEYSVTLAGYNEEGSYTLDSVEDIPIMDSYYYPGAKLVASQLNEINYRDDFHLRGQKSLITSFDLATLDDRVSPVIDLDRTNMTIVHNMVDHPEKYTKVTRGTATATLTFTGNVNLNNMTSGQFLEFTTRKGVDIKLPIVEVLANANRITVAGTNNIYELMNRESFKDMEIQNSAVEVEFSSTSDYKSEDFNDGSNYAKWISRMFVFEDECDGVEVKLSAIFYQLDDIKVYYKTRNVGHDGDFNKLNWTPFNPNGVVPGENRKTIRINEDTEGYYINNNEYMKTPGLADNIEQIKPRNPVDVDPRRILSSEWQSLTFSVQDVAAFDAIAIKIVMNSHSSALVPMIDDVSIVGSI